VEITHVWNDTPGQDDGWPKIYALICLSFIGLLGVTFLESRELASSLDQQKQIELRHLGDLALGIIKEEHAAVQKAAFRTPTPRSARWRGSGAPLRQQRLFLDQRHASEDGDASDQAGNERQRSVELQGSERQAAVRRFRRDGQKERLRLRSL
jgi:hypothetical protein